MSDRATGIASGFRDVDAHAQGQDFGAYLERVAHIMAIEKVASHDLLEPSPGQRLLDVGCGCGEDVRALARRVAPTGRAVGVDLSETLIAKAREGVVEPGVELRVADAHRLPFPDASFDAARVERTLQHVEDPARVLAEMARVVRPGGILVASEPDWGTLAVDAPDRESTREIVHNLCDHHIRNGWIGRQLAGQFARLGLTTIEVRPVTLVLQSFPVAVDILGLAEAGTRCWLEQLHERDRHGVFLASLTGFTVKGQVRLDADSARARSACRRGRM
jgi:ubiquinone/menaquinone biosynthesis C-methylase UbiE